MVTAVDKYLAWKAARLVLFPNSYTSAQVHPVWFPLTHRAAFFPLISPPAEACGLSRWTDVSSVHLKVLSSDPGLHTVAARHLFQVPIVTTKNASGPRSVSPGGEKQGRIGFWLPVPQLIWNVLHTVLCALLRTAFTSCNRFPSSLRAGVIADTAFCLLSVYQRINAFWMISGCRAFSSKLQIGS